MRSAHTFHSEGKHPHFTDLLSILQLADGVFETQICSPPTTFSCQTQVNVNLKYGLPGMAGQWKWPSENGLPLKQTS